MLKYWCWNGLISISGHPPNNIRFQSSGPQAFNILIHFSARLLTCFSIFGSIFVPILGSIFRSIFATHSHDQRKFDHMIKILIIWSNFLWSCECVANIDRNIDPNIGTNIDPNIEKHVSNRAEKCIKILKAWGPDDWNRILLGGCPDIDINPFQHQYFSMT